MTARMTPGLVVTLPVALLVMLPVALPVVLLAGCDGAEEPAATASKPPRSRPPRVQRAAPARPARPAIGAAPQPAPPPTGPTAVPLDRATEPTARVDTFAMVAEPTVTLDRSQPRPVGEAFVMVAPPAGFDRGRMVVTPPPVDPISRPVPAGFEAVASAGAVDGYARTIREPKTGALLHLVPGGPFPMGRDAGDRLADPLDGDGPADASPRHVVTLSPYYLAETETTLDAYRKYLEANPDATGRGASPREPANPSSPGDYPVLGLMYRDVLAFAKWFGGRLPTEAEWEKAARTAKGFDHVWGHGEPYFRTPRRPGAIAPAASEPEDRSRLGHFDLAGNAREWTADIYAADTYKRNAAKPEPDPTGAKRGSDRVIRGRSDGFSITSREGMGMSTVDPQVGFRMAVPAE